MTWDDEIAHAAAGRGLAAEEWLDWAVRLSLDLEEAGLGGVGVSSLLGRNRLGVGWDKERPMSIEGQLPLDGV